MNHQNQIISILFVSILLGIFRYTLVENPDFKLIKEKKIIKEVTSFTIPEEMSEPMSISLEFAKELYKDKLAIFIDARDPEEYELGHILNSINIPYDYYEDYEGVINQLDINSTYVIYCNGVECSLSLDLAEYLFNELLFETVLIFEGGWPQWRDAGLPS